MRHWIRAVLHTGLALAATASAGALAQGYPSKPIRVVVPFAAGGPTDVWARIVGAELHKAWGQPLIIDNRPGATGLIGSDLVRKSAPDGYTLLFTSNSAHLMAPLLRTPRSFDSVRDFTPVTKVLRFPMYLLTHPAVPAKTIAEFIAHARAHPRKLNFSSPGTGSGGHLACELFNLAAGTDIVHVPFQGAAPAQAALLANEVQLMCDSVGFSQPLVAAGKLRGLALTAPRRSPAVPDVPTLAEAGIAGVEAYIWLGLFGPPGLPAEVLKRLHAEVVRIVNLPDIRERIVKGGSEPIANTPAQFADDMRGEMQVWAKVIRDKNIKAE
jgi:tripartite-type tricarboxylate transporter receptor subunit TctC